MASVNVFVSFSQRWFEFPNKPTLQRTLPVFLHGVVAHRYHINAAEGIFVVQMFCSILYSSASLVTSQVEVRAIYHRKGFLLKFLL